MKKQKNILKIGLWISFMAFFALCITKNKGTAAFVAVAALAVTIAAIKFPVTKIRLKPYITGYSVIISVCINALLARNFYLVWYDSEKINSITQTVGISGRLCVGILTVLAVLVATPGIAWCIGFVVEERSKWISKAGFLLETDAFYVVCFIIAVIGIGLQVYCSFSMDIWGDEAATLAMIRHSYSEIVELTAADVHPPLYYWILKFCVDSVQGLLPGVERVYVAKLVSIVPFVFTLVWCTTKIRNKWGNYVAGMASVCLVGMPNLISYGVEIRMYSWGLFFVTSAFIYFAEILTCNNHKRSWSFFVAFSLLAAYTHYFACVAVAFLYLALLLYMIFRDRTQIRLWIIMSGITIVCYLPWLMVLAKQLERVSDDWWIPTIDLQTLKSYVFFMFGNGWLLILCVGCLACFAATLVRKKVGISIEHVWIGLTAFIVPIGTTAIGVVVSLLMRPVFVTRYMICLLYTSRSRRCAGQSLPGAGRRQRPFSAPTCAGKGNAPPPEHRI